jgi:parvulin-like peptidyl-prolyl isomerase
MRLSLHLAILAALCATLLALDASASPYAVLQTASGQRRVPLFAEDAASIAVAQVEGRTVTLQDLTDALAASHLSSAQEKAGKTDATKVLDRLIATQLILLEAHDMGIDELPEVKAPVAKFEQTALREVFKGRLVRDLHPDPAEVDRLVQEATREWKIRSLLFADEADAKAAALLPLSGQDFDAIARGALAQKKATGGAAAQSFSAKSTDVLPQVLVAVHKMLPGQISDPVRVPNGWALIELESVESHEDAAAREQATQQSVDAQAEAVLKKFYEQLMREHVHIDKRLVDSLDFQKKWKRLAKDDRVLARIDGGEAVRVRDLAREIQIGFFHGIDAAIAEKKVQEQKLPVFNAMLYGRVFTAEARRQGIEKTAEYTRIVADYRDSLVFGSFVQKAIAPNVEVTEGEGRAYYEAHKGDFTFPEYFSLLSLGFTNARAANDALARLRGGTDWKWLKANAAGQLRESERAVDFDGTTLSAASLSPDIRKALAGTKAGDARVAAVSGQHYVILVRQETPPVPQPYAQARAAIAKKLTGEKLNQAVADWAAKLRKGHAVQVFLAQIVS